jgi:hypothetical protein
MTVIQVYTEIERISPANRQSCLVIEAAARVRHAHHCHRLKDNFIALLQTLPLTLDNMASLVNYSMPQEQPGYSFSQTAPQTQLNGPRQHAFYP